MKCAAEDIFTSLLELRIRNLNFATPKLSLAHYPAKLSTIQVRSIWIESFYILHSVSVVEFTLPLPYIFLVIKPVHVLCIPSLSKSSVRFSMFLALKNYQWWFPLWKGKSNKVCVPYASSQFPSSDNLTIVFHPLLCTKIIQYLHISVFDKLLSAE